MDTRNRKPDIKKGIKHTAVIIVVLVLSLGIPVVNCFDLFSTAKNGDAVSGASVELPDKPSGGCVVLINRSAHKDTLKDWEKFFTGKELPVIFEDISCITAKGDKAGEQMAERYKLQLPENQMTLREEDSTLLASKAESGKIDVAIFSAEMADALDLGGAGKNGDVVRIEVSGGGK